MKSKSPDVLGINIIISCEYMLVKVRKEAKNMQKTCGAVSQGQRKEIDCQFLPDPFITPPCNLLTTPTRGPVSMCKTEKHPGNSRATKNKGTRGSPISHVCKGLNQEIIWRPRRPDAKPEEPEKQQTHCCFWKVRGSSQPSCAKASFSGASAPKTLLLT